MWRSRLLIKVVTKFHDLENLIVQEEKFARKIAGVNTGYYNDVFKATLIVKSAGFLCVYLVQFSRSLLRASRLNIRDWFARSHPSKGENRARNGRESCKCERSCTFSATRVLVHCLHQTSVLTFYHITSGPRLLKSGNKIDNTINLYQNTTLSELWKRVETFQTILKTANII